MWPLQWLAVLRLLPASLESQSHMTHCPKPTGFQRQDYQTRLVLHQRVCSTQTPEPGLPQGIQRKIHCLVLWLQRKIHWLALRSLPLLEVPRRGVVHFLIQAVPRWTTKLLLLERLNPEELTPWHRAG